MIVKVFGSDKEYYVSYEDIEYKRIDKFLLDKYEIKANNVRSFSWDDLRYSPNNIDLVTYFNNLEELEMSRINECDECDFESLYGCGKLKKLVFRGNEFKTLDFLKLMPNLEFLDCSDNDLKDGTFEYLKYTPKLKVLYCDENRNKDINFLRHLPNLEILSADFTPINDENVKVLANLKKLKLFRSYYCRLTSWDFLQYLPENMEKGIIISSRYLHQEPIKQSTIKKYNIQVNNFTVDLYA